MIHQNCGGKIIKLKDSYICESCLAKISEPEKLTEVVLLEEPSEVVDFEIEGKKYRMENMEVKTIEPEE